MRVASPHYSGNLVTHLCHQADLTDLVTRTSEAASVCFRV